MLGPYVGKYNATAFGLSCPQQATTLVLPTGFPQETVDALSSLPGAGITLVDGEDCEDAIGEALRPRRAILTIFPGLYLNVIAPAHAGPNSKLPVVVVCIMCAATRVKNNNQHGSGYMEVRRLQSLQHVIR